MFLRLIKLWIVATVLFSAADLVFSWNPIAARPYLAHRIEPTFRTAPLLGFGLIAEGINGLIAALSFLLIGRRIEGSNLKRGSWFGLMLWGFWTISGTMSAFVWLNIPTSVALSNIVLGFPKCIAIGCGIALASGKLEN